MKWDYSAVTVWGLDQKGPDDNDIFIREVEKLGLTLGCYLEQETPLNGYQEGFKLLRDGDLICQVFTGGTGSAIGSTQFIAASTANEVYPVLQAQFPRHSLSRADAAEDFKGLGTWATLEAMLTEVANKHGVTMAPFGEGHIRPDGTRDETKGRSWYFGSKSSTFRIVLYEKGLEQIAKGIPADPTWVRLEVRVRPNSKAKSSLGRANLVPFDLLGMSRWGVAVGEMLGGQDLQRFNIGSVWKPSEQEKVAVKICRMFDRGLDSLLAEYGTPEAVGRAIYGVKEKTSEAKQSLNNLVL
jgi:hypothetical protein